MENLFFHLLHDMGHAQHVKGVGEMKQVTMYPAKMRQFTISVRTQLGMPASILSGNGRDWPRMILVSFPV